MNVCIKEVFESAPETDIYIINTDDVEDEDLRNKLENEDDLELGYDTAELLKDLPCVDLPCTLERLVNVWVGG